MCGINGFNFQDQQLILKMNELTSHRGPDQTDIFLSEEISLGHNRLSVIDLSERGRQPMKDEAGELTIVFNGEIYNFQELRRDLEKKYSFKSKTDTEVILYAYREYGPDCVKKFNGIFAFAIWDARTRELFIARDRMGIKPLYYYFDGVKFIFSSEIKAILAHDIPRALDAEAFNLFFHVLYVPEPFTMFAGIKKLPPAHWLKLKNRSLTTEKYWEVGNFEDLSSRDEAVSSIRNIFKDAVRRQLISDRPVGVFLSGGLDSTAVLGAVAENSGAKTKTFSVGFDVKDEKFNADFFLARSTAKHYGTDHRELIIGPKDIADNLEKIVWHLDEPNFNPTAAAIYLLSQKAKTEVAVVLGGDGGDELFGGYPRYYFSRLLSYYQNFPAPARFLVKTLSRFVSRGRFTSRLEASDAERVLSFLSLKENLLSEALNSRFLNWEKVKGYFAGKYFKNQKDWDRDFERQFMNLDRQSWLLDESLLRTDKMSMAFGLEERVPILDHRLVEISARVPTRWKLNVWQKPDNFQGKTIWREAIREYLPGHILKAKKRGWFTPMAKWLRADLRGFAEERLFGGGLNGEFFQIEGVRKIWYDHLSGARYNLNLIWAIIMWQMWHEKFIKNR